MEPSASPAVAPLLFSKSDSQTDGVRFLLTQDWGRLEVRESDLQIVFPPPESESPAEPEEEKDDDDPLAWLRKPPAKPKEEPSLIRFVSVWGTHSQAEGRDATGEGFGRIFTPELWAGGDHYLSGESGGVSFSIELKPDVGVGRIAWEIKEAQALDPLEDGSLRISTQRGLLTLAPPQFLVDGSELEGSYQLEKTRLGFRCEQRRADEAMTIVVPSIQFERISAD